MAHLDLVSRDDIESELQQLGLDIDNKEVLERMKYMCLCFNITCEKLVEAWYSYQLKRKIRGQPSIAHLDQFERNVLTKEYVKVHDLKSMVGDVILSAEISSNNLPEISTVIDEDGMLVTGAEPEEPKSIEKANDAEENVTEDEVHMEVNDEPIKESIECPAKDLIPGVKEVTGYYGESLEEDSWKRTDPCDIEISHYDPTCVISKDYKILDLRLQDFADLMDDLISNFQDEVIESFPEIGSFTDVGVESAAPAYFCGRILKEIQGARINSKSIILEGNGSIRKRIKLGIDGVNECSLFPGQIVGVKGINAGERGLQVLEFLGANLTLPPLPTTKLAFKKPMTIFVASGPFGTELDHTRLIEHFKIDQPHIIILIGPFVSSNEIDIIDPLTSPSSFVTNFIDRILKVTTDSQIIAVPSPNDFFNLNIVPTTFTVPLSSSNRVHEMPNPCLLNISGCIIGISSTDIILDLLKEEFSKGVSGERMKRLYEHLLFQRSFYPLFPPGSEVNIDYSQYQHLRIPVRPHILILPSDTKNLCREISDCICVNPGKVFKKVFGKTQD